VTGAGFKGRIEDNMTRRIGYKLDSPKKLLLAAAIAGSLAVGIVNAPWLRAQEPHTKPLAFEVVSIKRVILPPGQTIFQLRNSDPSKRNLTSVGNRFTLRRFTLNDLIVNAYDVEAYQILGLPAWGKPGEEIYDVIAKAEGEASPTSNQLRLMLQTLLADRFQLKLHRETRELPLYYLVTGKNGLKMKEIAGETQPPAPPQPATKAGRSAAVRPVDSTFGATGAAEGRVIKGGIGGLIMLISLYLDHPLIDKTGLTGTYEYTWEQQALLDEIKESGRPAPSIFQTVERLGLKLEARKGPLEVLVIDRAERPSEN
jgi:uncharacterized protein (TIGR03435 family)